MLTNDTYGRLTLPMASGVSEVLVDHGVSLFLCATNNDPRLAKLHLEALLDRQVDGIIFTATRIDLEPPPELTRASHTGRLRLRAGAVGQRQLPSG